ncbi:hypothetical protein RF11_00536 [Thelohanellus kitauei]|uniref:Uncharacterized protein n=1 Tax=Thelohanellus kitauei TaxID=669202 RepID=A0A0C2J6J2_THEKT|nr:hypothetical protein RF11_00536 [Thelohanellus kitauei]
MKHFNQYNWNASDSFVYASNDYGYTFSKYSMIWNGKPVYVTRITSIHDYMFCQSEINSSFFYFNADLQISYYQTYTKGSQIKPHREFANYVSKLVLENTKSVSV